MSTIYAADGTSFTPDAVMKEDIVQDVRVTDHPIEDGSSVSDHSQTLPLRIVITCLVTESPISSFESEIDGVQRILDAFSFLNGAVGQLLSYQSDRYGLYESMMIEGFPSSVTKMRSAPFTISLKQVKIATFATVDIAPEDPAPVAEAGAPDEVDTGEQPTDTPTPEAAEDDSSYLKDGLEWLGVL